MPSERVPVRENLWAHIASKNFLPSMDFQMSCKIAFLKKSFWADCAKECFIVGVESVVSVGVASFGKSLRAKEQRKSIFFVF